MSVLDRIYDASPAFFQNIMCSVKGWLIQRRRFNDHFFEELKKYEKRVYDPEKELIDFLYDIRAIFLCLAPIVKSLSTFLVNSQYLAHSLHVVFFIYQFFCSSIEKFHEFLLS